MDSNQRSRRQQIYSLPPLATRELSLINGAGRRIRTPDLLITNQLLYRLSYTSDSPRARKALYYTNMHFFLCQSKNRGCQAKIFAAKTVGKPLVRSLISGNAAGAEYLFRVPGNNTKGLQSRNLCNIFRKSIYYIDVTTQNGGKVQVHCIRIR